MRPKNKPKLPVSTAVDRLSEIGHLDTIDLGKRREHLRDVIKPAIVAAGEFLARKLFSRMSIPSRL